MIGRVGFVPAIALASIALAACLGSAQPTPTAIPPAAAQPAATATASPTPAPAATATATATPLPPTLAIPADFAQTNAAALAALQQALPGLRIERVADAAAALARVQAKLATAAVANGALPAGARLLCLAPYAPIVHFNSPLGEMTTERLRSIYQGNDWPGPVYYSGDAQVIARILGAAPGKRATALPSWQAVIERVAADRTALAFAPWAAIDARVKTLPLDGRSIAANGVLGYGRGDQWWLSAGADESLQAAIVSRLACPTRQPVTFIATGDILMGWYVHEAYLKSAGPLYPFRKVRDILRAADIAFADFENPMPASGAGDAAVFAFAADPSAANGLADAGIDVVNLANNHMGDFGPAAVADTLVTLRQSGIGYIGAGRNAGQAHAAWITSTRGVTIAMLGYNEVGADAYAATDTQPGVAWLEPERVVAEIKAARAKSDFVIVSLHWGNEYTAYPTEHQQELARLAAQAGAGLVIGDHPHVVQAISFVGRTFVTYSLGDFVYVQPGSPATGEALILRAVIEGSALKQVDLLPVYIDRAQPAPISPVEGKLMMARIFDATHAIAGLPPAAERAQAAVEPIALPSPAAPVARGQIAAVALNGPSADIVLWNAVWSATSPDVAKDATRRLETSHSTLTSDGLLNDAPAFSPDGKRIAYSSARSGNVDIYVASADGSGAVNITNNAAWDDYPAWSPDGRQIAFSSNRNGAYSIFVMNADGSAVRRLTGGSAWDTTPAWSPDGKRIAFASDRARRFQIFSIAADGSDLRTVTSHPHSSIFPSWSPDGRSLVFQSYRDESVLQGNDANQDRDYEIFACNADGSNLRQLTSNRFADIQPAWSPDGKRIAFASDRGGAFQIYTMAVDGSDVMAVTSGPGAYVAPRWSP